MKIEKANAAYRVALMQTNESKIFNHHFYFPFSLFIEDNCARAKIRAKLSFDTLWLVYKQVFELSKTLNYVNFKVGRYKEFFVSAKDFLRINKECDSNMHWNANILKVRFQVNKTGRTMFQVWHFLFPKSRVKGSGI